MCNREVVHCVCDTEVVHEMDGAGGEGGGEHVGKGQGGGRARGGGRRRRDGEWSVSCC